MSDKLVRALQSYLKGEEWKDSIEIFVTANCKEFRSIEEMTHVQFELWKTYQEIVENILEMAMECAGGTISSLEKELIYILKHSKARGPKDARVLDIIERLLSFDEFYNFALMMNNAYNDQCEEVHKFTNKDVDLSRKNTMKAKSTKGKSVKASQSTGSIKYTEAPMMQYDDPEHEARVQKMYEENYYALYNMGYTDEDIYAVMNVNRRDLTLDQWVAKLNNYIEEKNNTTGETYADYGEEKGEGYEEEGQGFDEGKNDNDDDGESKCSDDMLTESRRERFGAAPEEEQEEEEQWEDENQFNNGGSAKRNSVKVKLKPVVQAFVRASEIADGAEFNAKFTLAESIKDTFDAVTSDTSEAMKKMINWSSHMLVLRRDMDDAYRDGIPFQQYGVHHAGGLVEWYRELEASRKDIDESSIGGNMISDSEITRMIELDNIAMLGSEDEQYLHTLLTRHDTVTRDVKSIYLKINILVNNDRHITRAHIEELYVYLKQQVANNSNLDEISDDLYEFVSSRISSAHNSEVLSLLLDLHLLEDEEEMLKKKIQAIAGGEPEEPAGRGGENQSVDAGVTRMRIFSGEGNGELGISSKADGKNAGDGRDDKGFHKNYESKQSEDGQGTPSSHMADSKFLNSFSSDLDSKQSQYSLLDHKQSQMSFNLGSQSYDNFNHNDALLNALKDKHKSSLFNLKNSLETEKAKRLKELEAKLQKRRQKIKQLTADGRELDAEQQNELEQQQNEMLVVSEQMTEATAKYNSLLTNMVSGYRKKCLAELKLAKKNIASGCGHELTAEDMASINKDLSGQILSRFERDTQSLLDRIEADRVKQRNKLLLKLAKKRAEVEQNGSGSSEEDQKALAKLERKTANSIEKLDATNAEQVAQVLMESQTHVLNALSALHLEDTILTNARSSTKEENEEEEDDFYFDEETSGNNKLGAWLERMGTIQDNYLSASKQIQFKLNYVNNNSILVQDDALLSNINNADHKGTLENIEQLEKGGSGSSDLDGPVDTTYSNVTSHMMKVVVDAFATQMNSDEGLQSIGNGEGLTKPARGFSDAESESMRVIRVKEKRDDTSQVRAAIFAEFEKTKADYDNVLNVSKANSKQKLLDRRNQSRSAGPAANLLESVVDSFLENPLSSELDYKEQVTALISPRSTARGLSVEHPAPKVVHHSYRDANDTADNTEDKDRIKALHTEREKHLEEDLYANMMAKKKKLEERLAKKKAQAAKAKQKVDDSWTGGEDDVITAVALKRQEQEAKDKLAALEKAFETIQSMMQSASKEEMKQFDLKSLINMMEQKASGQDVSSDIGSNFSTKASMGALVTVREDEDETVQVYKAVKAAAQVAPTTARSFSALPPVVSVDKEVLAEEAKRIAYSYNEENQKQDLMMKIKETRQRQKLQRKLLEKKQSHATNLQSLV